MNNLQPLVWRNQNPEDKRIFVEHAQGAGIFYTVYGAMNDGFGTRWHDQMEGSHGKKEGFWSIAEIKHWIETDHYPSKMQPYVKPSPTKVYELAFDYEDGYFTVFMTTDKQHAIDFKESIKNHDQKFMKDYGFDDDADEVLTEQYESNHPLKPHAIKIFNSLYEDSFSEWAISYAGSTFASQLSIIEHELNEVTK